MHGEELGVQMIHAIPFKNDACPSNTFKVLIKHSGHFPGGLHERTDGLIIVIEYIAGTMSLGDDNGHPGRIRINRQKGKMIIILPYAMGGRLVRNDPAKDAVLIH